MKTFPFCFCFVLVLLPTAAALADAVKMDNHASKDPLTSPFPSFSHPKEDNLAAMPSPAPSYSNWPTHAPSHIRTMVPTNPEDEDSAQLNETETATHDFRDASHTSAPASTQHARHPRFWLIPAFAGVCTLSMFLFAFAFGSQRNTNSEGPINDNGPKTDIVLAFDHPELIIAHRIIQERQTGQKQDQNPALQRIIHAIKSMDTPVRVQSLKTKTPHPLPRQPQQPRNAETDSDTDSSKGPSVTTPEQGQEEETDLPPV